MCSLLDCYVFLFFFSLMLVPTKASSDVDDEI